MFLNFSSPQSISNMQKAWILTVLLGFSCILLDSLSSGLGVPEVTRQYPCGPGTFFIRVIESCENRFLIEEMVAAQVNDTYAQVNPDFFQLHKTEQAMVPKQCPTFTHEIICKISDTEDVEFRYHYEPTSSSLGVLDAHEELHKAGTSRTVGGGVSDITQDFPCVGERLVIRVDMTCENHCSGKEAAYISQTRFELDLDKFKFHKDDEMIEALQCTSFKIICETADGRIFEKHVSYVTTSGTEEL